MPKITLKKIAAILGISPATVSKALKDYPDISNDTKIKVKALAESLNYKPNSFAQSLRNQESKIIGLIIPKIVHHFFSNIINGVIDAASNKGYLVITLQSHESYEQEKDQINSLIEKNVDGILISLSDHTVNYKHINAIIEKGVPVVLYDRTSKLVNCSKVIINDRKAGYEATKYLIETGCRKIAHIRGPLKPQTTIDRFMGYKNALKEHDLPYDKNLVFETEHLSFEDGFEVAEEIAKHRHDIDGVFSTTDLLATGVMVKLQQKGIKVPDDISIMGFSNWFLTKITTPTLSTIDQPGYEMGRKTFDLLYDELCQIKNGESVSHEVVEIATRVVPRNSTKFIES